MALRAFHSNPGIGGFGESTTPALNFLFKEPSSSHKKKKKKKNQTTEHSSKSGGNNSDDNNVIDHSNGHGDLLCQIVKELVDNAVDACRSSCSRQDDREERHVDTRNKKRIKVDIRPPPKDSSDNSILQVTVSDNGCGMENIQDCVNAFHSSKGGDEKADNINVSASTSNSHTSGRYGIGLTLCILHAQRCVPNSRVCITSVSEKSKYRTRAIFEVDEQGDSVDCVQEEVTPVSLLSSKDNASATENESGTCVSLLVPGGVATTLAWPRLNDYFTRFRLCTNLHFELHVFAPTLTKFPIYIRHSNRNIATLTSDHEIVEGPACAAEVGVKTGQPQERQQLNAESVDDDDEWGDLLDDLEEEDTKGDDKNKNNDSNDEDNSNDNEEQVSWRKGGNRRFIHNRTNGKSESDHYAIFEAAKSFWPERGILYKNVARSIRNIPRTNYIREENTTTSEIQLEVSMVVCPCPKQDEKNINTTTTEFSSSSSSFDGAVNKIDKYDYAVEDRQVATLQLIRMVNGVPILDSGEAHSCGLVHGVANKVVWGSFGLEVTKNAATHHDTTDTNSHHTTSTPSFQLLDSSIIAPFINRNINHRQLRVSSQNMINGDNDTENKKRKRDNDLLPANIRIGTILVVVHIHAAPSSLPLPTLSKGRLPLNHRPIDSALQLGLRDCLTKLQSTNQDLFLTSTRLRAIEREVRYIPGIASAVSRIICRSSNQSLRRKSLKILKKIYTEDKSSEESLAEQQYVGVESTNGKHELVENTVKIDVHLLADAFQNRLRLAMQVKNDFTKKSKRCKKQKDANADDDEQEYGDFDSEDKSKDGLESVRPSIEKSGQFSIFSSSHGQAELGMESFSSYNSSLSQRSALLSPNYVIDSDDKSVMRPVKEILIENASGFDLVMNGSEDDFDDW